MFKIAKHFKTKQLYKDNIYNNNNNYNNKEITVLKSKSISLLQQNIERESISQ